ncbi:Rieske (2Fe-2S) protein [Streptomyces sp. NPDC059582]|uniref:Rieske (2Fe-2S) protein n=1 Tax=Streptomyces sp. NPDC059582 TaxID=3346875 RepID=UPI00368A2DA4
MIDGPTRRTVLATGAVAFVAGCSNYGDSNDSASAADASSTVSASAAADTETKVLAKTGDIPVGGGKIFAADEVVVTQPKKGEFKAFTNICTHRQCPVASVSDGTINCTCHGSKFHIADGSVAHPPAAHPLAEKKITVTGDSISLA